MEDKKEIDYTIFQYLVFSWFLLIIFLIWNNGVIRLFAVLFYCYSALMIISNFWRDDILTNISNIVYCIINSILLVYFIVPIESGVNYLVFHFATLFVCFPLCLHLGLNIRNLYYNTFGELKAKGSDNENNTVQ